MREGLVGEAAAFALFAHKGQTRKYTGEPYIVHPAEVAGIVADVNGTNEMIAAAWLHDVVEDCGVCSGEIHSRFGHEVGRLVDQLTKVTTLADGKRTRRMRLECERWATSTPDAQTIKLADLISNTRSIVRDDPKFAKVYLKEKNDLLMHLAWGHAKLFLLASQQVAL